MAFKTMTVASTISLFAALPALADAFSDKVVSNLQELGYTSIEIEQGPTQLKAEAVNASGG